MLVIVSSTSNKLYNQKIMGNQGQSEMELREKTESFVMIVANTAILNETQQMAKWK